MKQMLDLARALIHRPPLIIPGRAHHRAGRGGAAALGDDLGALVACEGVTVFLTTHNMAEAEKLCGSVGVLSLLRAPPEVTGIERQDSHLSIHLREEIDTAPLVSLLVSAGAQVEEVHQSQASLEEAFMALMEEEE